MALRPVFQQTLLRSSKTSEKNCSILRSQLILDDVDLLSFIKQRFERSKYKLYQRRSGTRNFNCWLSNWLYLGRWSKQEMREYQFQDTMSYNDRNVAYSYSWKLLIREPNRDINQEVFLKLFDQCSRPPTFAQCLKLPKDQSQSKKMQYLNEAEIQLSNCIEDKGDLGKGKIIAKIEKKNKD